MQGVSTLSRSLEVQMRRDAGRYLFPFDCDLADPFAALEQKRADARWRVLIRLDTDNVSTGMFLKQEDASCENLCRNATYVYLCYVRLETTTVQMAYLSRNLKDVEELEVLFLRRFQVNWDRKLYKYRMLISR